jgi:hypothetical protein
MGPLREDAMSRFLRVVIAATAVVLFLWADSATAKPKPQREPKSPPPQNSSRLDEPTRKALLEALDDERKAKAFYQAVLGRYGQVRPFANIVEAEARHESALLSLLEKYGIQVPTDAWLSRKQDVPLTLVEACRSAINVERENVALYDRLLKTATQEAIRLVMNNLRSASHDQHLPAFERCTSGACGRGWGAGGGNGGGRGWRGGRGRVQE